MEVLLVEIERQGEHDDPDDDRTNEAKPLVVPDGVQHAVIILRERTSLVEQPFQFRVHMFLVYQLI